MSTPFVTAVCITGKTSFHIQKLLPVAIECFKKQDYPPERRALLLVSDNRDVHHVSGVCPSNVYCHLIARTLDYTLGDLRNQGLESLPVQTDLVIQWDDDDWHPPQRIGKQVEAYQMCNNGLPVCLAGQIVYCWKTKTGSLRYLPGNCIHGSILHPKNSFRYPSKKLEEDTDFLSLFGGHNVLDDPALYVRFFWGDDVNAWDRKHLLRQYAAAWATGGLHLSNCHRAVLAQAVSSYSEI